MGVEVINDRVADVRLVAARSAARGGPPGVKFSAQIEIGVGRVVAQRGVDARRQVGVRHCGIERAADAARIQDGVAASTQRTLPLAKLRLDRRAAERRGAGDVGKARRRRIQNSPRRTRLTGSARLATVIDEPGVPLPDANVPPALTCTALAAPVPVRMASCIHGGRR